MAPQAVEDNIVRKSIIGIKKENPLEKSIYKYEIFRRKVCEMQEGFKASAPERVAEFLRNIGLASEEQEHMVALTLDAKNKITGYYTVAIGTADNAAIHFRDVFRRAILLNSLGIILCHQHPSGECEPSSDDIRLTQGAKQAGEIIGIKLLDHVIVSETGYYSFVEKRII